MRFAHLYARYKNRRLIRRFTRRPTNFSLSTNELPKRIWIFWHSGYSNAPDIVKFAVDSWQNKNPEFDVCFLDEPAADSLMGFGEHLKSQALHWYSDLLRVYLLKNHGGIWADATCLCAKPLDCWLPAIMTQSDFFAFKRPGSDRVLSSWFLAAKAETPMISAVYQQTTSFLNYNCLNTLPYFWFHYNFEYMLLSSRACRKEWSVIPSFSAKPPHVLDSVLIGKLYPNQRALDAIRAALVHKLSWKNGVSAKDVRIFADRYCIVL